MKKNKGFTLIELLVVIAIIGILSAIVLASLSTARTKATAAKVQGELSSMRAQAEVYYTTGSGYGPYVAKDDCSTSVTTNIFGIAATTNGSLKTLMSDVITQVTAANTQCAVGNTGESATNGTSWAVSARDPSLTTQAFCVDSGGVSKVRAETVAGAAAEEAITVDATSARCT